MTSRPGTLGQEPSQLSVPLLAGTAFVSGITRLSDRRIQPCVTHQLGSLVEPVDLGMGHQPRVQTDLRLGHQQFRLGDRCHPAFDLSIQLLHPVVDIVDEPEPLLQQEIARRLKIEVDKLLPPLGNERAPVDRDVMLFKSGVDFVLTICTLLDEMLPAANESPSSPDRLGQNLSLVDHVN